MKNDENIDFFADDVVLRSSIGSGTRNALDFPDSSESFAAHTDFVKALQLPETVQKSLSTAALVETCLNYPLLGDMGAYNSLIQGIEAVKGGFNGYAELFAREDAALALSEHYARIDPLSVVSGNDLIAAGEFSMRMSFLEMLLSDEVLLKALPDQDRKSLFDSVYKNSETKRAHTETYGIIAGISSAYLLAGLMALDNSDFRDLIEADEDVRLFMRTSAFKDTSVLEKVFTHAEKVK